MKQDKCLLLSPALGELLPGSSEEASLPPEESRLPQKNYKEGCVVFTWQDSKRKQGIVLCQERQKVLGIPSQKGSID